jgi:hypothetical protein
LSAAGAAFFVAAQSSSALAIAATRQPRRPAAYAPARDPFAFDAQSIDRSPCVAVRAAAPPASKRNGQRSGATEPEPLIAFVTFGSPR